MTLRCEATIDILNTTEGLSPLERLADSTVQPTSNRQATELEVALVDATWRYEEEDVFLVYHMHEGTGEYTGFSVGGLTRVREEQP